MNLAISNKILKNVEPNLLAALGWKRKKGRGKDVIKRRYVS
jgi:hypothetical protein